MSVEVRGRDRRVTDSELRDALAAGLTQAEIAQKYGVTRGAISKRVKNLEVSTVAAVAPVESQRFVSRSLDAMEELSYSLAKVRLLMDACDEWLRDADDPSRYNLDPRSSEVEITYEVEERTQNGDLVTRKRKKRFSELCAALDDGRDEDGARFVGVVKGEHKHADPRELILKTAQETRATISAASELVEKVYNARAVDAFRRAMMEEIAKVDPDVAERIAQAVRRSITLFNAASGFEGGAAGGGGG